MRTGAAVACALLAGLLGAGLAAAWLRGGPDAARDQALDEARREALARLVATTRGVWDVHPDPLVAKILLPDLAGERDGRTPVDSNALGLREAAWEQPKPPGTVRVVLLGDSFVFGMGVEAHERLGVHLRRELLARAGAEPAPAVEVLHVGITSWSLLAECSFVRRQLALLQPDLVIHHVVPNDLDDTAGVRGFGMPAQTVPRFPGRADAVTTMTFGRRELDPDARSLLPWAQDAEGRARLAEAVAEVQRLAGALRAAGARYVLLANWHGFQAVAGRAFAPALEEHELAFLPRSHYADPALRISPADEHWNPAGHADVAAILYGLVRARDLLPGLQPGPWPEAEERSREVLRAGLAEALRPGALDEALARQRVRSEIDARAWTPETAGQVYTGIDADGHVAPYACFVLAREEGTALRLTGRALDRPELDGARVTVEVEGQPAGAFELRAGQPVDFVAPLPAEARSAAWLAVRLVASDFVHDGADLRRCRSFRLERAAVVP